MNSRRLMRAPKAQTDPAKGRRCERQPEGYHIRRRVVLKQGSAPIEIDYGMEKKADAWKCYDIVVGGVSLVTNYRDEFNDQIRRGGVDGLIKALADRNRGAAAK